MDIIGAKKVYVEMLGDIEIAIVWDWLYFMRDAGAKKGKVAKSDSELAAELHLSRYKVRQARDILKKRGWITVTTEQWAGSPTTHYHINVKVYQKDLRKHLGVPEPSIPEAPPAPVERSEDVARVFADYEANIGIIIPMTASILNGWIDDYPIDWIVESFEIAAKYNKRNLQYCGAILKRWSKEGRNENGIEKSTDKVDTIIKPTASDFADFEALEKAGIL